MSRPWFICLFLPSLVATYAAAIEPPANGSNSTGDTLAEVAGRQITVDQLLRHWRTGDGPERAAARLEEMVELELLHAAAMDSGYSTRPEVVDAIRRLVVEKYLEDNLQPDLEAISVEDDEVAAYYHERRSGFTQPAAKKAAVLRISVPETASLEKREALRKRAVAARKAAGELGTAVASFGAVAVEYSDEQTTRYRGGEIGWLEDGGGSTRWDERVIAALQALADPGSVSPVVETEHGFYLVKLMDVRPGRLRTLEEVRRRIVHKLYEEKRRAVRQELFDRLAKQISVEVHDDRLQTLIADWEAGAQPPSNPD